MEDIALYSMYHETVESSPIVVAYIRPNLYSPSGRGKYDYKFFRVYGKWNPFKETLKQMILQYGTAKHYRQGARVQTVLELSGIDAIKLVRAGFKGRY